MATSKVWKTVPHNHYPGMLTVEGPESAITVVTSAVGVDFDAYPEILALAEYAINKAMTGESK